MCTMVSLPKARYVRGLKILLLLCPMLLISFGLLFTLTVANLGHHKTLQQKDSVTHRKPVETSQEMLERTGVCAALPRTYPVINSSSVMNVTLDNGSQHRLNSSMIKMCYALNKAMEDYFTPSKHKVQVFNHKFIISGSAVCDNDTEIVVLIHSLHSYYDRRKAIRDTWGGALVLDQWPNKETVGAKAKVVFVLGKHSNRSMNEELVKENKHHQDVIQGDFQESYNNMTLKSLLGLKWVSTYCPQVKYLVKSDDDMIINFPYLVQVLRETNMTWAVMGPYNAGSRALKKGKWSIPHSKYPFYYYPPYESGSAYIINSDLIQPLFRLSEYVPHIFIDDVYITGILGKILKARHVTHSGFAYWVSKRPRSCDLVRNVILTGTKMRASDLTRIWTDIKGKTAC